MTSSLSGLALFGLVDPGTLLLKLLAVVGGFTLGAVATGWLAKLLAKFMGFQSVYPFLLRWSRLLGGLAIGFVVWAGLGGGGGGWWPFGQGGGPGNSGSGGTEISKEAVDQGSATAEQTLRILMLGGDKAENDQRFYRLEGEKPRTWQELELILTERNTNADLKVIEIVIGKGSVDEHSEAVHEIEAWASKNGVAVKKTTAG